MDNQSLYEFSPDTPFVGALRRGEIARFIFEHLRLINFQRRAEPTNQGADMECHSNSAFWNEHLEMSYWKHRWVKLSNFQIVDWFPRTPGLYHTRAARRSREAARPYLYNDNGIQIFLPEGKSHMVRGGIGSVRFKPRRIEDDECWLYTATSDGYCHSGVPLAIPNHLMSRVDLQSRYLITGQTRFLPTFLEPHFYHMRRIPQIYLMVDSIEKVGDDLDPVKITPMVFFAGAPGSRSRHGCVTYATCRSNSLEELDRVASRFEDYARKFGSGEIITNFDEQRPIFEQAPFSLQNIMNGRLDTGRLNELTIGRAQFIFENVEKVQAEVVTMSKNEIKIGDNVTIHGDVVAAHWIEKSFNKVASADVPSELKDLLSRLAVAVGEMNAVLPKETAQQAARDLDTLVAEATSSAPRKEWWQLSIEGLKKAASNAGEIGKPVLEIAALLVSTLTGKLS